MNDYIEEYEDDINSIRAQLMMALDDLVQTEQYVRQADLRKALMALGFVRRMAHEATVAVQGLQGCMEYERAKA
jgi:hypothetical protein